MSGNRKRLYYRLTPVFAPEPGALVLQNAAIVTCMATGRTLAGMGGGGLALSTEIVDELAQGQDVEGPRLILNTAELETIRHGLRMGLLHYLMATESGAEDENDKACRAALEAGVLAAAGAPK